MESHNLRLTS